MTKNRLSKLQKTILFFMLEFELLIQSILNHDNPKKTFAKYVHQVLIKYIDNKVRSKWNTDNEKNRGEVVDFLMEKISIKLIVSASYSQKGKTTQDNILKSMRNMRKKGLIVGNRLTDLGREIAFIERSMMIKQFGQDTFI